MYLDVFRYIQIIVLKYAEQETKLVHFSPHSRDQLKAHVLICHHLLPSPAPSLVSNAVPTRPPRAAAYNMESFLCRQLVLRAAFRELIPL